MLNVFSFILLGYTQMNLGPFYEGFMSLLSKFLKRFILLLNGKYW